jgi:hypothetical protein
MQEVLAQARRGDRSVLGELRSILDANPWFWEEAGDLARATEQSWIDRVAGQDLVFGQSLRRRIEKMKSELAGEEATALERLLASRIALHWLASQQELMCEGLSKDEGSKILELRMKRAESTNRRFLATAKTLAAVRRLRSGLRVEIHSTTEAMPSNPAVAAPRGIDPTPHHDVSMDSTQDRLNSLFGREIAAEEALAQEVPT